MPTRRFVLAALVVSLGSFGFLGRFAPPAPACDAVVVGRAASTDGSVLVGHNEENALDRVLEFRKIPRRQHAVGAQLRLENGGRLDEASETAAFLWSENPGLRFSDGYLNEYGVAVVSIQCRTREDDYDALVARGEIREGGIGYMLRRITIARAKTASAGVDLFGQLVERFGYSDSGRTYVIADPTEAWIVEVVRGRRWAAQRVPDDRVVVLPAQHVIGEIDLNDRRNFRASPDLIRYATQRGWFDPAQGKPFHFGNVYQTAEQAQPQARRIRGQEMLTGRTPRGPMPFAVVPRKKLSPADVIAFLRDKEGPAPWFNATTQEAAVFQLRDDLPREIGCVYWRTTGRPDVGILTPWYVGITATPESYGRRTTPDVLLSLEHHFQPPAKIFQPDASLAWWKFKALVQWVDADAANRAATVRAAQAALEQRLFRQQAAFEADILKLRKTSPDAARARLTQYCEEAATESCRAADRFLATPTTAGR